MITVASLAACLGASQPGSGKSDVDALQGVWQLVGGQKEGKELSQDVVKEIGGQLTFKGEELYLKGKPQGNEQEKSGTFKLDAAKKPKHIDITDKKDGTVLKGIYELNGDDFRVCLVISGSDRPAEFSSNVDFLVFKRAKK